MDDKDDLRDYRPLVTAADSKPNAESTPIHVADVARHPPPF